MKTETRIQETLLYKVQKLVRIIFDGWRGDWAALHNGFLRVPPAVGTDGCCCVTRYAELPPGGLELAPRQSAPAQRARRDSGGPLTLIAGRRVILYVTFTLADECYSDSAINGRGIAIS